IFFGFLGALFIIGALAVFACARFGPNPFLKTKINRDTRFLGGREKITEFLFDWFGIITSVLVSAALVGLAAYHAFFYYFEHYFLAALGMMVGITVGFVIHEIWIKRISFGLLYGLCVLLGAWLLFGLLFSGGGDPDCFAPRYC
ncbi:MAG: hypothetical protein CML95_06070, partial [Rhodobiaceae bacterium]|nr:hypothetical protein [Rhodobiaceae bacterium]